MRRLSRADLRRGKILLISLRRCRTPKGMSDRSAILAANAAFYAAFATGDADGMARLWAEDDNISCIHPGWPAIVGRLAVIESWRDILGSAGRPQITCHDPNAIVTGNSGCVLCVELMGPVALAASNHFRLINGEWQLSHHQSSPIAPSASQSVGDPSSAPSGQIH